MIECSFCKLEGACSRYELCERKKQHKLCPECKETLCEDETSRCITCLCKQYANSFYEHIETPEIKEPCSKCKKSLLFLPIYKSKFELACLNCILRYIYSVIIKYRNIEPPKKIFQYQVLLKHKYHISAEFLFYLIESCASESSFRRLKHIFIDTFE